MQCIYFIKQQFEALCVLLLITFPCILKLQFVTKSYVEMELFKYARNGESVHVLERGQDAKSTTLHSHIALDYSKIKDHVST